MIIHSYAEMLSSGANHEQVRAKAGKIIAAVTRGANLTRQLLAFSRRQILKPSIVQLDTVVSDFCHMLKPVIGEDIRLQVHSTADLWPLLADRGQLEQVILNLAINARDAMPHGGELSLSTRNVQLETGAPESNKPIPAGDYVELTVTDTGYGMSAETQARIFEPFFTTKPAGKGTGLGPSTVYGIVKQSGGYVMVESNEGAGTTFRIYLPRTSNSKETQTDNCADAVLSAAPASVLVVEDEEATREALCSYLEERGFAVASAGTAAEAVTCCSVAKPFPQVILTDVILPDRKGPELVEELQRSHPELKVVFMSGYASDRISPEGLISTEFEYLQKPFELSELVSKIRGLTGNHEYSA